MKKLNFFIGLIILIAMLNGIEDSVTIGAFWSCISAVVVKNILF